MSWLKKRIDAEWNENGDVDVAAIAREFAERALRMANGGNECDGDMHLSDDIIAEALAAADEEQP